MESNMFWKLQENVVGSAEIDSLVSFIRQTKRFTQFTKVKEFESAFSLWQGCKYSVFVNSGSSANLLLTNAVKQLRDWRSGDEVIVPAVTWPTTITPVIQCGLKPVFVDVNLKDLSFDYDKLISQITPRTRGIFVAHLLGFPADTHFLKKISREHDIVILEDCCESQGAIHGGSKVGNIGLAGSFSFYWGHHMTTVEGGMICTGDEELYNHVLLKRSHGLARELPSEHHGRLKAQHPDVEFDFLFLTDGFNLRNTEFNAVLGLAQLQRMGDFIRIRNRNYAHFLSICKNYPEELIVLKSAGISSFVLPFVFRDKKRKERFQACIRSEGIESRPLISGNLLRQPFLKHYSDPEKFPNAELLHTNAFYIGNNQYVDEARLDRLDQIMLKFFRG